MNELRSWKTNMLRIAKIAVGVLSFVITAAFLLVLACGSGSASAYNGVVQTELKMMDRFDTSLTNRLSEALDGVLSIEKVYWLSDDDKVAPEPDQTKFGSTKDPSSLGWLLEEASDILDGQETTFQLTTKIAPKSKVNYYLDDSIFAVTWKQVMSGGMYTISEVKIKHPSQLRRFLSGGEYGSGILLKTTQMAKSVNAVVASSGDFYSFRRHGVIVYDGIVQRTNTKYVQTCFIDKNGDMLFSYAGQLSKKADAQAFVDEHGIRFSIAFGPVLIDEGKYVPCKGYLLGEIWDDYPRAALCQKDELHYLVVALNSDSGYQHVSNLKVFAKNVEKLGVQKAYTLDGGQTTVIVMNDKMINAVLGGSQRNISDIFYFATAIPSAE